ncbi:MAG: adenine phosphoribosyltransferase [Proteobacteria bacterium]|nr:MAG: adenine phosphoribosyltransferase [Pseudomonadota bacterium]
MDLRSFIRDVPDFPKPGITFMDITPLIKSPLAFRLVMDKFQSFCQGRQIDAVVGIESRGFIFGAPLALSLSVPFVPLRKPGKLPAEKMSAEYALEYGSGQLDIHKDALTPGQRVVIVDDLLATGGTARAAAKLVEFLEAEVGSFLFVVELSGLEGAKHLGDYSFMSLVKF